MSKTSWQGLSAERAEETIEAELERFVTFGTLLDSRSRRYLCEHLLLALDPRRDPPEELDREYLRAFGRAVSKVFEGLGVPAMVADRPELKAQIVSESLFWLRRAGRRIDEKDPFEAERQSLAGSSVVPPAGVVLRWSAILRWLEERYSEDDIALAFFRAKFAEAIAGRSAEELDPASADRVEILYHDLLRQWDAALSARRMAWQLERLEHDAEEFRGTLEQKVEQFQRLVNLIGPFTEYLGRHWDLARGLWEDASFDVLERWRELFEREESIRRLADLLGRLQNAERAAEDEVYARVVVHEREVVRTEARAEVTGIRSGSDLEAMLGSEVALLATAETESAFLARYADGQLAMLHYQGRLERPDLDRFEEREERVAKKDKGPFVICVDTSDSMSGDPERFAKLIAFGVLKIAMESDRRAFLINFSTGIQTLDLLDLAGSLDDLARFLTKSFHGGTDLSPALHASLARLESEAYEDADVLVVSDFIVWRIEADIVERVRRQQSHAGTRFHALTVGEDPNVEVLDAFDSVWRASESEGAARIESLGKHLSQVGDHPRRKGFLGAD